MNQKITPEIAILNLLIFGEGLSSMFALLIEDFFPTEMGRRIFRKLKSEWNTSGKLDLIIADKILGGSDFQSILCQDVIPGDRMFPSYLKAMKEEALKAKFYRQIEALKNGEDVGTVLDNLKKIHAVFNDSGNRFLNMEQLASNVIERIINFDESKMIKSWIPSLDQAIVCFRPGEVYVYAARTAVGKTSFTVNLMLSIADQGKRPLVFSGEINGESLMQLRIFPVSSGEDFYGFMNEINAKKIISDFNSKHLPDILKRDIIIADNGRPSLSDFEFAIDNFKPSILIIDHLHRCSMPKSESYRLSIKEFMMGLTELAKKHNIPILLAAQVSRALDKSNEEPTLSDLSESKAIEEEATAVLMFWKEKALQTSLDYSVISAKLEKNRHGLMTRFKLRMDKKNLRIRELEQ